MTNSSDWFSNLEDVAGVHPHAEEAHSPPKPRTRSAERASEGSLEIPGFSLTREDRLYDSKTLVEAPLRADGLGKGSEGRRIHLRLTKELDAFLYAHTRGSVNSVIAALLVHGFEELQRNNKRLVLTPDKPAPTEEIGAKNESEREEKEGDNSPS